MFSLAFARNVYLHQGQHKRCLLLALAKPKYELFKFQQRSCKSDKCPPNPPSKSDSKKSDKCQPSPPSKKKKEDVNDPCGHIKKAKEAAEAAEKKKREKEMKEKSKKGKEKPKQDGLQRIRYWQARFQCADGLPVFLKLGTRDKILYYSTLGLCVVGILYTFYTAYELA